MLNLILTLLAILLILVVNEVLWRKRTTHGEFSRKFVHMSVGAFAAFWPFYLSWGQIELIALSMFVVVIISKYLGVFQAIHSVQRATWGEATFALSILLIALLTNDKWIFTAAIFQMSIADGLAALVGVRFGRKYSYIIFKHTKSLIGTLAFFVASVLILFGYAHFATVTLSLSFILIVSVMSALLENIAVYGLDNVLVPLFVAFVLINH
ncbi:MAG TPA: hypothetical protein VL989_01455 [Candidatus Sulfotelmatobacter sp.]|nr:hypothetical protein [Candidatus Sulfotelmatobacter sp.]